MFSKDKIIECIKKYEYVTFLKLVRDLGISSNLNKSFSAFLNELKKDGQISFSKKNNAYFIPKFIGNFDVEFKVNNLGNAFSFININQKDVKVMIFDNDINALKDDLVNINVYKNIDEEFYFGILINIVKRKNNFIYAQVDENLNIKPIYFSQNINLIYKKEDLNKNTYVKFKIDRVTKDAIFLNLDQELFSIDQPYSDIDLVVEYSNINKFFSQEVIDEAKLIPDEVKNVNDFGRIDLSNNLIVTIDGEKTKDFDDAISVEKTQNNTYKLGVHIADVAYYVKEDSNLDLEARSRGTSIYLIDKVIPMLPEKLSNGICSLNPNVKRFTLTLESEIDQNGSIIDTKLYPSMIESKYRLTYNQVANMENENFIKSNLHLYQMLKHAYELSEIISKNKVKDGYIDFEIKEPVIELDPKTGKTISIKNRERLSSEILIENFMVFANESVSKMISDLNVVSIYRTHEAPSIEKIDNLKSFIKAIGINDVNFKYSVNPKDFQKSVNNLKRERFDNLIKMSLLKTMQKAKYSIDNIGHFGLASKYYSHFTSPIRRYPDLLLHRIIWEVIIKNNKQYSNQKIDLINSIATSSTNSEIKAVEIERKVNDIKKAEYYQSFVGQIKDATIVSIQKFGIFVEFDDATNSLVHISTFCSNNEYEISSDLCKMILKEKAYIIGQKVKVKITSINKLDGKIDSIFYEN